MKINQVAKKKSEAGGEQITPFVPFIECSYVTALNAATFIERNGILVLPHALEICSDCLCYLLHIVFFYDILWSTFRHLLPKMGLT